MPPKKKAKKNVRAVAPGQPLVSEYFARQPPRPKGPFEVEFKDHVALNEEQRVVFRQIVEMATVKDMFVDGRCTSHCHEEMSVFVTGLAGTGKSFVISNALAYLRTRFPDEELFDRRVIMTASTGMAAQNVGGVTLHQFAGLGVAPLTGAASMKIINYNPLIKKRWVDASILIIDEISQVDASFFQLLEYVGRKTRCSNLTFGGIMVVACGDFFQLPPIGRTLDGKPGYDGDECVDMQVQIAACAFESEYWDLVFPRCRSYFLQTIVRQEAGEALLIKALNQVRINKMDAETIDLLRNKLRREHGELPDGIKPAQLYSRSYQVAVYNTSEMDKLPGMAKTYVAETLVDKNLDADYLRKLKSQSELTLKVGTQVMATNNSERAFNVVNGSQGVVRRLNDESVEVDFRVGGSGPRSTQLVVVQKYVQKVLDKFGRVLMKRAQLPLQVSHAISIHKSQGQSLEFLTVDLDGAFAFGQAYVALSRARSLAGLRVKNFSVDTVKVSPKVLNFYAQFGQSAEDGQ